MPPLPMSHRQEVTVAREPLALTLTNVKRIGTRVKAKAKAKTWSAAPTGRQVSARAANSGGLPRPRTVIRDNGSTLAAQPSVLEE
eukprot:8197823-Pyramimonas_sp.AAC.1